LSVPCPPTTRFFDAHCDTFLKVVEQAADFEGSGDLQVTLPGMLRAGIGAQVFAAWTMAERLGGREDEVALQIVDAVTKTCREHADRLVLVRSKIELQVPLAGSGRIAAICGLEGADPLKGDPRSLAPYYEAGVRLVTLIWDDNVFGGSSYGSGSGLTNEGEELVAMCEELGVMVDVSHASDRAFWDVCAVARSPFIASHSNCRELCDNPRNLTDKMIRAVAERGGVVGINLYSGFLSPEFSAKDEEHRKMIMSTPEAEQRSWDEIGELIATHHRSLPRPPLSLVADHVKHLIAVGGEDCVGLGGDLDGTDSLPDGIEGVADYPKIVDCLRTAGLTQEQIDKVCWGNFWRVFREVLP
jgi:membrane dipeptidase